MNHKRRLFFISRTEIVAVMRRVGFYTPVQAICLLLPNAITYRVSRNGYYCRIGAHRKARRGAPCVPRCVCGEHTMRRV